MALKISENAPGRASSVALPNVGDGVSTAITQIVNQPSAPNTGVLDAAAGAPGQAAAKAAAMIGQSVTTSINDIQKYRNELMAGQEDTRNNAAYADYQASWAKTKNQIVQDANANNLSPSDLEKNLTTAREDLWNEKFKDVVTTQDSVLKHWTQVRDTTFGRQEIEINDALRDRTKTATTMDMAKEIEAVQAAAVEAQKNGGNGSQVLLEGTQRVLTNPTYNGVLGPEYTKAQAGKMGADGAKAVGLVAMQAAFDTKPGSPLSQVTTDPVNNDAIRKQILDQGRAMFDSMTFLTPEQREVAYAQFSDQVDSHVNRQEVQAHRAAAAVKEANNQQATIGLVQLDTAIDNARMSGTFNETSLTQLQQTYVQSPLYTSNTPEGQLFRARVDNKFADERVKLYTKAENERITAAKLARGAAIGDQSDIDNLWAKQNGPPTNSNPTGGSAYALTQGKYGYQLDPAGRQAQRNLFETQFGGKIPTSEKQAIETGIMSPDPATAKQVATYIGEMTPVQFSQLSPQAQNIAHRIKDYNEDPVTAAREVAKLANRSEEQKEADKTLVGNAVAQAKKDGNQYDALVNVAKTLPGGQKPGTFFGTNDAISFDKDNVNKTFSPEVLAAFDRGVKQRMIDGLPYADAAKATAGEMAKNGLGVTTMTLTGEAKLVMQSPEAMSGERAHPENFKSDIQERMKSVLVANNVPVDTPLQVTPTGLNMTVKNPDGTTSSLPTYDVRYKDPKTGMIVQASNTYTFNPNDNVAGRKQTELDAWTKIRNEYNARALQEWKLANPEGPKYITGAMGRGAVQTNPGPVMLGDKPMTQAEILALPGLNKNAYEAAKQGARSAGYNIPATAPAFDKSVNFPTIKKDPEYANYVSNVESVWRLAPGALLAIKDLGERSGANAVSPKGALGVFQFMPDTFAVYKPTSDAVASDPKASAQAAGKFLHDLVNYYHGNYAAAFAHYNGGGSQGALVAKGLQPSYPETRKYLERLKPWLDTQGKPGEVQLALNN